MLAGVTRKNDGVHSLVIRMKPRMTARTTCPANMLANKRTASTMCRINSPAISITNIKPQSGGLSHAGNVHMRDDPQPVAREPHLAHAGPDHDDERHQGEGGRHVDVARGRSAARESSPAGC